MQGPPELARIEQGIAFQHRVWQVERIGWAGMAAFLLAAILGAFGGGGPLAEGVARAGGVEVAWPRMARLGRTEQIHLSLPPGQGPAELRLAPDTSAVWRQRDATPPPVAAAAGPDGVTLRFARDGDGAARIALHLEPIGAPGPRRLRIAVAGEVLDLAVFVWP